MWLDRLRCAVIEASKQCGRNRLMAIQAPQDWREFVGATTADAGRLIAHPGADRSLADIVHRTTQTPAAGFVLTVGPEGGFTPDEAQLAIAAGWTVVDLVVRICALKRPRQRLAAAVALLVGDAPQIPLPAGERAG